MKQWKANIILSSFIAHLHKGRALILQEPAWLNHFGTVMPFRNDKSCGSKKLCTKVVVLKQRILLTTVLCNMICSLATVLNRQNRHNFVLDFKCMCALNKFYRTDQNSQTIRNLDKCHHKDDIRLLWLDAISLNQNLEKFREACLK